MSFFPLRAAKQNGIPIRIAHSHNSHLEKDLKFPIKYMAQKSIGKVANQYYACGKLAGDFMFHDSQYSVIHNAINLDDFVYNESERIKTRKQLGLEDKFVIGHVGRFCRVKNQLFVLDIFTELSLSLQSYLTIVVFRHDSTIRVRYNIFAVIMAIRVIRAAMPASALENGRFSTSNSTNTNKVILFSFREK
jgi:glycosyltransferase involved in cell wall biosynthesis